MSIRDVQQPFAMTGVLLPLFLILGLMAPSQALAATDDPVEFDARIELRAVQSDLDFDEGEEIDSSGFGARADVGATWKASDKTAVRIAVDAGVFDYTDDNRETRESVGGRLQVTHEVSDEVELRVYARRVENIALLEAFSADQTSAGARVQWQKGNDRVRLQAEYREREYDLSTPATGDGYRVSAQYNRRLGSYHWVRLDVRHEDMKSEDSSRRSFERRVARIKYSLPVAKRLRVRPSVEYREWKYDSRIAQGDPDGDLREDSYVAPGLEVAWGRGSRGPYATASAEYRLRTSNDERYDSDAIRVGVRVGYRF